MNETTTGAMPIGRISALFRYPVKSMAGVPLDRAALGWHGLKGDRRFAFRRLAGQGGFPFLTASRLPQMLLYRPLGQADLDPDLPTHVRTPDGAELELRSAQLQDDVARRHGGAVELLHFKHGIFDDGAVSVITMATIRELEREAGRPLDVLRFRPNIVIDGGSAEPFSEDRWLGKTLLLGDAADAPTLSVTQRDLRCVMINFDPQTAESDPVVMKTAVRLNGNHAGIYATVTREGELQTGQPVYLA
jgi:uncharacterized protein YcbX